MEPVRSARLPDPRVPAEPVPPTAPRSPEGSGSGALETARLRRAELHAALLGLERALAAPAPGRESAWVANVGTALAALTVDFREHVAVTEGPGGLYQDVLSVAPRLGGPVRRLVQEHSRIAAVLSAATASLDAAAAASDPEACVAAARARVTALLGALVRHRQRGADVVWEAYSIDIGGET